MKAGDEKRHPGTGPFTASNAQRFTRRDSCPPALSVASGWAFAGEQGAVSVIGEHRAVRREPRYLGFQRAGFPVLGVDARSAEEAYGDGSIAGFLAQTVCHPQRIFDALALLLRKRRSARAAAQKQVAQSLGRSQTHGPLFVKRQEDADWFVVGRQVSDEE